MKEKIIMSLCIYYSAETVRMKVRDYMFINIFHTYMYNSEM